MREKLLFICSGNLDRSPTAEDLFKNSKEFKAKSAGTHLTAVKKVSQKLINWADIIFTLCEKEDGHLTFLKQNFDLKDKKVYDLDISDIYDRGDPVLISILKQKISKFLPQLFSLPRKTL